MNKPQDRPYHHGQKHSTLLLSVPVLQGYQRLTAPWKMDLNESSFWEKCLCSAVILLSTAARFLLSVALCRKKGIKDSADHFREDILKAGNYMNHPKLVEEIVREAPACYNMMVASGVKFRDEVIRLGGHSSARTIFASNYSGGGICVPMHKHLRNKGVSFRNRSFVSSIVQNRIC